MSNSPNTQTFEKKVNKELIVKISFSLFVFIIILVYICINKDRLIKDISQVFFEDKSYLNILFGLKNTLIISICGLIVGCIIGIIVSIVEVSPSKNIFLLIFKNIERAYVSIMRGTPITVQLLIIYFIVFSWSDRDILIAIAAFGLNSGAYVSEIMRGGINSVPIGQVEAGRSLGLSYSQTMIKIIVPQAFKNVLPSIGNEFVSLIKETSVVGFIGAVDLTLSFRKIGNATFNIKLAYLTLGVTYFVLVFAFSKLLKLLERGLSKSDQN